MVYEPMLNIETLVKLIGGTVPSATDPAEAITGCCIDSRQVKPGHAFFALPGEKTHGIHFARTALQHGASVVVSDAIDHQGADGKVIPVEDAAYALAQVAHAHRQQHDSMVIGVTGTVGKTTTRRAIAAVMQMAHRGIQSPRNYNNQLGVPLSLLNLSHDDDFAVIEVGASYPGEIAFLASVAQPEMSVITHISPVHLQGMNSLQTIQNEKAELIRSLPASGIAFLNADDALVAELHHQTKAQVVSFGFDSSADIKGTSLTCHPDGICVTVDGLDYTAPLIGRHHATSVLAAIAVGLQVGIEPEAIQEGLKNLEPASGRCTVVQKTPFTVIDDTYNSSPASVLAAAKLLKDVAASGRRILVLNDMLDLGEQAPVLHYGVGASLATTDIDHLLVTGTFANEVVDGFLATDKHSVNRVSRFDSTSQLIEILECMAFHNDVVLVKGSRATEMEHVVAELIAPASTDVRRAA